MARRPAVVEEGESEGVTGPTRLLSATAVCYLAPIRVPGGGDNAVLLEQLPQAFVRCPVVLDTGCGGAATGMKNVNVAPRPGLLLTLTAPL